MWWSKWTAVYSISALAMAGVGMVEAGTCNQPKVKVVAERKAAPEKDEQKNIVETAVAAGSFKTLAKALEVAGLVEALQGEGPFTVFAPTDEAFEKLPQETLEAVLKDKEKLTAILTYHVVSGKVLAADVVKLEEAETLLKGTKLKIDSKDGVKVNNANVVKTDIKCTNGVIHVIDTVLIPE